MPRDTKAIPKKAPKRYRVGRKLCELFGIWSDHEPSRDVGQYVRALRKRRQLASDIPAP